MIQNRDELEVTPAHEVVLDCIEAGITASQPRNAVTNALSLAGDTLEIQDEPVDLTQFSEIQLLGGGKAATQMAQAIEDVLGDRITTGIVVTNDAQETTQTTVVKGAHPTPNASGRDGAAEILSLAEQADEDTLILFPLSGGGSALLPLPAGEITLTDLQSLTDDLLASGASIDEINTVRKHLSQIKGGQFAAAAAPATVVGLVLSDVVGNDVGVIASGPIVGDDSTYQDAQSVLATYDITPPATVEAHLTRGCEGEIDETPSTGGSVFDHVDTHILADATTATEAAVESAADTAFTPLLLSTRVEGEAREIGKVHAAIADEVADSGAPIEPPALLLSAGEATVTLSGDGLGGPNQEFVLGGLLQSDVETVVIGSVDTDGEDGATDAAGAIAGPTTVENERDARAALSENDTYDYFAERNGLIHTGPTGTNVNDLRILAVTDQS